MIPMSDGMKPMSTAPKDGTAIAVFRLGHGLYSVHWTGSAWEWAVGKALPEFELTHWRPLRVARSSEQ